MKTMKKLVAALLVLTMVLALTGSAFAACDFTFYNAKFKRNARAYTEPKSSKKTSDPDIIVHKGSTGVVLAKKGNFVLVALTAMGTNKDLGNTKVTLVFDDREVNLYTWAYWFKKSDTKCVKNLTPDDLLTFQTQGIQVTFSNGGVGMSVPQWFYTATGKPVTWKDTGNVTLEEVKELVKEEGTDEVYTWFDAIRLSPDCMKKIKATSKVWLHKEPGLKKNYGVALHAGDKVTYRRVWAFDTRFIAFYGVKYKGKCLWVSSAYTKPVKK